MPSLPEALHRSRFGRFSAFVLLSSSLAAPLAAQLAPIGLSEVRARWFDSPSFPSNPANMNEGFASALAIGDFNGDGAGDLVSGIPEDNGFNDICVRCGAAQVRFGRPGQALPSAENGTLLSPQHPAVIDLAQPDELFGAALAVGDFNGDDRDDLAVGVPRNRQAWPSGAVVIHYGLEPAAGGIQPAGEHVLQQGVNGLPGSGDDGQSFGHALATGDFDNDGFDDLAVAAPHDAECGSINCGTVTVLYGGIGGLMPFRGHFLHQGSDFIADDPEDGDQFGWALTAGDFDGNEADDLAIGIPGEDGDVGAVQVVFGSQWGLLFVANGIWRQEGLYETSEPGDAMGRSLVVGNFDGDAHDDLAVGVPYENLGPGGSAVDAGLVILMYGGPEWFDIPRTQLWTQDNIAQAPGHDEILDSFGFAIAAGDFDGDGFDDLAAGHPSETTDLSRGAVTILMGAPGGAIGQRHRTLYHGVEGIPGDVDDVAWFGQVLAAGDLDGDGFADLALGMPSYIDNNSTPVGKESAGAEIVLYGALFADGFELGATGRWSAARP